MSKMYLFVIALLTLGSAALAEEELYRWREADGTLTFSPKPPPASSGIAFEKISSSGGALRANKPVNSRLTNPTVSPPATVPATSPALATRTPTSVTSATKEGHCSDLQKRVQSLETLIMTDVSNETMDNAVIQMARYQTSFNQSCRGIRN